MFWLIEQNTRDREAGKQQFTSHVLETAGISKVGALARQGSCESPLPAAHAKLSLRPHLVGAKGAFAGLLRQCHVPDAGPS